MFVCWLAGILANAYMFVYSFVWFFAYLFECVFVCVFVCVLTDIRNASCESKSKLKFLFLKETLDSNILFCSYVIEENHFNRFSEHCQNILLKPTQQHQNRKPSKFNGSSNVETSNSQTRNDDLSGGRFNSSSACSKRSTLSW